MVNILPYAPSSHEKKIQIKIDYKVSVTVGSMYTFLLFGGLYFFVKSIYLFLTFLRILSVTNLYFCIWQCSLGTIFIRLAYWSTHTHYAHHFRYFIVYWKVYSRIGMHVACRTRNKTIDVVNENNRVVNTRKMCSKWTHTKNVILNWWGNLHYFWDS